MWDRNIESRCVGKMKGWLKRYKQAGLGSSLAQPADPRQAVPTTCLLHMSATAHLEICTIPQVHICQFARNLHNHYYRCFHVQPHFKHCTLSEEVILPYMGTLRYYHVIININMLIRHV